MKCLNCGEIAENKFCSHCGQKTSTHRFSLKHFFSHDIIHGAFHLDKGFPLTIKELFTKPGTGVRKYIQGKRARYFNYITLILIIIGFAHFLEGYTKISLQEVLSQSVEQDPDPKKAKNFKEVFDLIFGTIRNYPKLSILSFIPFYALISFWIFKKSKLNYAEHLVLVFYQMSAIVLLSYIDVIIRIFTKDIDLITNASLATSLIPYLYTSIFMYRFFSIYDYSKRRLVWKSIRYTITQSIVQGIIMGIAAVVYLLILKLG